MLWDSILILWRMSMSRSVSENLVLLQIPAKNTYRCSLICLICRCLSGHSEMKPEEGRVRGSQAPLYRRSLMVCPLLLLIITSILVIPVCACVCVCVCLCVCARVCVCAFASVAGYEWTP